MVYLGKPNGISLEEHVENVKQQASHYLENHSLVQKKYGDFTGNNLKKRLNVAAKYHDDGKKHPKWQDKCKKDFEEFRNLADKRDFVAKNLRHVGLRHELVYLDKQLEAKMSWPVLVAIAAHHQQLSQSSVEGANNRWKEAGVEHIWEKLRGFSSFPDEPKKYLSQALFLNYEYSAPRYLLQLSDHRASANEEDSNYIPKFEEFKYQFTYPGKKEIQQIAEENWKENLLLLRAPTGSGKTDAALLWAKKQIEKERADRLVIAMPTRFTSNALTIDITEDISKKGVYHSSSWFNWHYEKSQESEDHKQVQKKGIRVFKTS